MAAMATPDLNPSMDHWWRDRATGQVRDSRGPERVTNEPTSEPVVKRPVGFTANLDSPPAPQTPPPEECEPVPLTGPLVWEGDFA